MINKIVGYGGFKSYAEQHYPTKKQGKQLQNSNNVWSETKRDVDKINPLNNYNHYHTLYKNHHVENTQPADYHPDIVKKGAGNTINFQGTTSKPYDQIQAEKSGQEACRKGFNPLQTGTEHWKTNYQAEISHPNNFNRTVGSLNAKSTLRAHSTGRPNSILVDEQLSKALSYKNRPYINNAKTGTTDYRFNFGDKIGFKPTDLLSGNSIKQPIREHPLKKGTNQLWTEIPGYQGFKPSQLQFQEVKLKMAQRANIDRGNKKLNLTQNYHVNVPGYAGFKPKFSINPNRLRESCFDSK